MESLLVCLVCDAGAGGGRKSENGCFPYSNRWYRLSLPSTLNPLTAEGRPLYVFQREKPYFL
ncbi:MAG: hypothetical protein R2828_15285 [Saprospiraceae bacterium]